MKLTREYCANFCASDGIEEISTENDWGIYQYSYNIDKINNLQETLFMTGIGMNNVPHLMTLVQLVGINDLSVKGLNTRIVLGDYDVILARDKSLSTIILLKFIKNLFKESVLKMRFWSNQNLRIGWIILFISQIS